MSYLVLVRNHAGKPVEAKFLDTRTKVVDYVRIENIAQDYPQTVVIKVKGMNDIMELSEL